MRLFVSPCGTRTTWLHPLDLKTDHYPQYANWIDATDLNDDEFEALVVGLQTTK